MSENQENNADVQVSLYEPSFGYKLTVGCLIFVVIFNCMYGLTEVLYDDGELFGGVYGDDHYTTEYPYSVLNCTTKSLVNQSMTDMNDDFIFHCLPATCGHAIMDGIVNKEQVDELTRLHNVILDTKAVAAAQAFTFVELFTGHSNNGDGNYYTALDSRTRGNMPTSDMISNLDDVINNIKHHIEMHFHIRHLVPALPLYFESYQGLQDAAEGYYGDVVKINDKPWNTVTAVIYLSNGNLSSTSKDHGLNYTPDFDGGNEIWHDVYKNEIVYVPVVPLRGRVVFYTSGPEHVAKIEKVRSGTRKSIAVSFTCNKQIDASGLQQGIIFNPQQLSVNKPIRDFIARNAAGTDAGNTNRQKSNKDRTMKREL